MDTSVALRYAKMHTGGGESRPMPLGKSRVRDRVMEEPHDDATTGDDLTYAYKSSVLAAPFEFRLTPDTLWWEKGGAEGHTLFRQIRRVRLSFRPLTMQNHRFVAEVWTEGPKLTIASTSWKSLVEHERLDARYREFVIALCRRIGAAGGHTLFQTGSPAILYWIGVVVFAGGSLALAGLIVRALQDSAWGGAAFIAAFLGLFLWQAGTFFRRNRPGLFRPDAVPDSVLPRG